MLDSALNRPYQTFDKKELYPTPTEKAAALFESLISNHPFVDGNKRISWVLMRMLLLEAQLDISADAEQRYEFVLKAASGETDYESILKWLKTNTGDTSKEPKHNA